MKARNICLECGKVYVKPPTRCMCGWYFVKEESAKLDRSKCHFLINGKQCNEAGSTTFMTKSQDWFCGEHARKLREESYKR